MDVSAFSGGTFDPRDWINLALRVEEPQGREAAAGGLVMRLQLMIARVNSALEEQCQAVVQAVPRLVREAEQLEQEAALLRDKLVSVKKDVARVEAETAGNMSSLVLMDTVKERVALTRRALQEADNWSSLDGQAEDAFEADALDTVAARLAGMAGSLRLLAHTEDYRERVAHLEHQRNRLEATLSPQVAPLLLRLLPSSSSPHPLLPPAGDGVHLPGHGGGLQAGGDVPGDGARRAARQVLH